MAYEWLNPESSTEDWVRAEKEPNVVLSQYGVKGQGFRNRPRLEGRPSDDSEIKKIGRIPERDLSMIEGRVSAEEAARAVFGRVSARKRAQAKVRYFRVARLWECDLGTFRSPSRRNPMHVSVVPSPRLGIDWGDLAAQAAFWDDGGSSRLDDAREEGSDA